MTRYKVTSEKALFKDEINKALFKSDDIVELLLGDTSGMTQLEKMKEFKKHVKSHLFIEETIKDADTFIFYDVVFPKLGANIKQCMVIMYAITQRDTLEENDSEKYLGDKIDALSQMIEDALINDKDVVLNFGIGELLIDSLDIYNSNRFYGSIFKFSVPNFRYSWK